MNSEIDGIEMSCFYPMDLREYSIRIVEKGRNSYFMRHGYDSRLAIAKAVQPYGSKKAANSYLYKFLDDIQMDTV